MSLLSSSAKDYNVNDSTFLFSLLAKYLPVSSTRRVTVLRDKKIFSNLLLLSGHKIPAVSTMHSLRNSKACWSLLIKCQQITCLCAWFLDGSLLDKGVLLSLQTSCQPLSSSCPFLRWLVVSISLECSVEKWRLMLHSFETAMVSWQIRHTAFDRTSVKKYLVIHSVFNNWQSLSTFLFFGPLIVADEFRGAAEWE